MIVIERHAGSPQFTYEGAFGPSIPLIDPEVATTIHINQESKPVMLHVTSRINGSQDANVFAFEIEENIEIDPQEQPLDPQELLTEVINSVNRCFDKAYEASITNAKAFPFPRTYPELNTKHTLSAIEQELS